jgi:AcrR family transcriptional regulator
MNFLGALARRLAWEDYEKVSVAMICRDARSTLHTFYRRFPNKRALEYAAIYVTFKERIKAFDRAMAPVTWKDASPQAIIHRLVDEIIASTLTVPTIGITQLALRLGMSKPMAAEPCLEFRTAITDRAVELLAPQLTIPNPKESMRAAIQMVLAMAADEAWRHGIPLTTSQKRKLAKTSGDMVLRYLGLPAAKRDVASMPAVHPEAAEFPEKLQFEYAIRKRSLRRYAKRINASHKPAFTLGFLVDPLDAVILATKAERRKTEKPMKRRPPKRRFRLI